MTENQQTNKPTQQTKQEKFDWTSVRQRAKKVPNILPSLKLDVNEYADVEFLEDEPTNIEVKDEKSPTGKRDFPFIPVRLIATSSQDNTTHIGQKMNLPLSGISIQNGVGKLAEEKGELQGIKARISVTEYKHKKWGKTKSFDVQEISSPVSAQSSQPR